MTGRKKNTPAKHQGRSKGPSTAKLDKMIEEAIVDAYGESEQIIGFYTMLEDNLTVPFRTEMLGVEVTVERIDMTDDERIVAVCSRGKSRQRVSILDLPLPNPHLKVPSGSLPFADGHAGDRHGTQADRNRPGQAARGNSHARERVYIFHAG